MTVSQGAAIYRELLRYTKQLPREARSYYSRHIRETFNNFLEEGPERVQQLAARAREDAQWVLAKYSKQQQPQQRK